MRTFLFWLLVVAGIGALFPPLFTHGACTEEFDVVSNRLESARSELLTLPAARAYRILKFPMTDFEVDVAK